MKRWWTSLVATFFALSIPLGAAGGDDRERLETRMRATVDAGDVSGKARWEVREGRRKFSVEIEGFTPGEAFAVLVNGVDTGVLVAVDNFGVGEVDLDDRAAEEVGDLPFPPNFPPVNAGDDVVVGPLKGTFFED